MTEVRANLAMEKTLHLPVRILEQAGVEHTQELLKEKPPALSFRTDNCARFSGKGACVLLDFGKELCGGVRILTREVPTTTHIRITFGESVSEACASLGVKNAGNDHSPRDMEVVISSLSDLEFGQTGYRFVRITLLDDCSWDVLSIYGTCTLPKLQQEMTLVTSDPLLNKIIDTALYTLKLCWQNGFIWDGIKRDRLIWCGDMHPEILTGLYAFGKTENITNSLDFLRENTPKGEWINTLPSYSAWWVACLCEYTRLTGDTVYFEKSKAYALEILAQYDGLIDRDGTMHLPGYFLDWPTAETKEAEIGTALLIRWVAQKYLELEPDCHAEALAAKLRPWLYKESSFKQVRAFQVLSGEGRPEDRAFLEAGGGQGMSTFMAYYILSAAAKAGSGETLSMLKDYYGGMLSRGATTFWEDFDLTWLEGSGRIDELPHPGEADLHGDYGKFCYQQFRHSLCHGWSAGVLAFVAEHILGLQVRDGYRNITVRPHLMGLTYMNARIPTPFGILEVSIDENTVTASGLEEIRILY